MQQSEHPTEVQTVKEGIEAFGITKCELFLVDPEYYSWTLEKRMEILNASSINDLCKSVVFENTRWRVGDDKFSAHRYVMVIVQYTDKINSQKLNAFIRERETVQRSKKMFNMRVTTSEVALDLTGFSPGGINPFGITQSMPIIITENISRLNCMFLGAGHLDWKVACNVNEFVQKTGCHVVDLA